MTKSRGLPRASRMSREKRWKLVRDAQGFKTGGLSDSAIRDALIKDNPGMDRRTARRILAAMYADFDRDAKHRRKGQLGSTLAGFDRAKRIALTKQRLVVVEGELQKHPEPDGKLYLDALEAEAKLLGINAPERREVVVSTFDVVWSEIVEVMRREIVDPLPPAIELMRRLARGFRAAMEAGARTIKSERVVDAAIVTKTPTTPSFLSSGSSISSSKNGNFAVQSESPGAPGANGQAPS